MNPLESLVTDLIPTTYAPSQSVLNKFPLLSNFPYRIAIIGEAPGKDEVDRGEPFVGMSGRLLNNLLSRCNIVRDACFIGNICQLRPPNNDITCFKRDGEEIQTGLKQLTSDLKTFNPNVCLLLGKTALWAAKNDDAIGDWRGSIFISTVPGPFFGRKCIAAYHPAACLRQYDWTPLLMFDIKKCRSQAETPSFTLPIRDLKLFTDISTLLTDLDNILLTKPLIAIDIEGWVGKFVCISIAPSPDFSFIVPFSHRDGRSFFDNPEDEFQVWRKLTTILADPVIPKVLQNSLYDRFVLQYSYDVIIAGVTDDTMLKNHELYCELEKSLGFQCSLYTDEPYYKFQGRSDDRDTFWEYCCRDSAVTYEINSKLTKWLSPSEKHHYDFNINLLNPLLFMECRGILYNTPLAQERLAEVNSHVYRLQGELDKVAGFGVDRNLTREQLLMLCRSIMCYKRNPTQPKKDHVQNYSLISSRLFNSDVLDESFYGLFNVACDLGLNIKGGKFKKYIYETLNCPKQYHSVTGELTTNYEALLKISKKIDHQAIKLALDLGELRTRAQMLEIHADKDGRIRCGYNIVGTETGRLTCYTSPTGSGYNLQTIPADNSALNLTNPLRNGMRDLFLADKNCYLFQCDLSGADGFTVAAHLANLGDRTMLDDYLAGIKPAKVLCYLLRHGATSLQGKNRDEIKYLVKEVTKDSWDYFVSKIGQHGSCYLMGKRKLANQVFLQSEGKVNISESQAGDLQRLFFLRYQVPLWHKWMTDHLLRQSYPPKLLAASGHTRRFFGRSSETLGEALAHEPQANTTYVCNLAAHRLWTDPDNRNGNKLRIEPLHQIHDAILGQFKIEDTTWAISQIRKYFDNPIIIAGQKILITFEGQYGTNWALNEKSKIGEI